MNGTHGLVEVMSRARRVFDADALARILRFLGFSRTDDGGFKGKGGDFSDVYFTFFGMASLMALADEPPRCLGEVFWRRVSEDLAGFDLGHLRAVAGLLALYPGGYSHVKHGSVTDGVAEFAAADGGFHHSGRGAERSTPYGMYLACEICVDLGIEMEFKEDPEVVLEGCGVSNIATRAAAALVVLAHVGRSGSPLARETIRMLNGLSARDGGFYAFSGAPVPDMLSTSSAIHALALAGCPVSNAREHMGFVESVWDEVSGGFSESAASDAGPDCEHTFHALLALGHLGPVE